MCDQDHHNSPIYLYFTFIFRKPSKPGRAPDLASPDVMKENQEFIRKRRPINFTLDDLENDEQDEAFDYQSFDPIPSTSRALPSRNCKKLYDENSSSDDEIYDYPEYEYEF